MTKQKLFSKEHYQMEYSDALRETMNFWRTKQQKASINRRIKKIENILRNEYKLKDHEF